ncbi:uncharacterized protein L201_007835 [Kwoniella dendrophila CBS 6074]|uniref:Uncharacterized protein n=1 Tax=Kwoniella dendrophila CBS 6074 TaxID=1295534 RepID=A0AAX4K6T1_9TREE
MKLFQCLSSRDYEACQHRNRLDNVCYENSSILAKHWDAFEKRDPSKNSTNRETGIGRIIRSEESDTTYQQAEINKLTDLGIDPSISLFVSDATYEDFLSSGAFKLYNQGKNLRGDLTRKEGNPKIWCVKNSGESSREFNSNQSSDRSPRTKWTCELEVEIPDKYLALIGNEQGETDTLEFTNIKWADQSNERTNSLERVPFSKYLYNDLRHQNPSRIVKKLSEVEFLTPQSLYQGKSACQVKITLLQKVLPATTYTSFRPESFCQKERSCHA